MRCFVRMGNFPCSDPSFTLEHFDPLALFLRSAQAWPHRTALSIDGREWSYAELDRWSDGIASTLMDAGAQGQRIGIVAEKTASTYAGILGILKASGAYVPFAPDGPTARTRMMIDRAEVRFLLGGSSDNEVLTRIPVPTPDTIPQAHHATIALDREAYVLFTSGSTGGPKGVSVSRRNLAHYLRHLLTTYGFNEQDRFTQFFALTFDLSVHDLFVCWGAGACLCVPDRTAHLRAAAFARKVGVTIWFSVPSLVDVMQRTRSLGASSLPGIRYAFFCGEALRYESASVFRSAASNARVVNLYGPTETTIAITGFELSDHSDTSEVFVPIGKPFPEHHARIIDEELQLAGPQLSGGYVGDEEALQRAFLRDDANGIRWYRTGDRVRCDASGDLHYLSRLDDQVKVAGHRVEPAEVDHVITRLLDGGRSVTVPIYSQGATRLVTFIDMERSPATVLEYCRLHLPSYMVPERIIVINEWPVTPHGKTDRHLLINLAQHA